MDPIPTNTFTKYNSGIKKCNFYSQSNPSGGQSCYNINKEWRILGGVSKTGKDFTRISSYLPMVGLSYEPACAIF